MKPLLLVAALAVPAEWEALVPCDNLFTTPVPAWVCFMAQNPKDTPVSADMQKEIDAAWEEFLTPTSK